MRSGALHASLHSAGYTSAMQDNTEHNRELYQATAQHRAVLQMSVEKFAEAYTHATLFYSWAVSSWFSLDLF